MGLLDDPERPETLWDNVPGSTVGGTGWTGSAADPASRVKTAEMMRLIDLFKAGEIDVNELAARQADLLA